MAAPIRFLSGRQQQQKIGIEGSTEDKKVLEVVGRTGIGTTSFEPAKVLDVRGDAIVEGTTTVGKLEITGTGDVPASITVETANVTGVSTFAGAVDVNAGLDVDGQADLDEVVVAGVATFSSAVDINSTLDVDGDTQLDDLTVAGVATFSSAINATDIIKGYEYTAAPSGSTVTLAVTVASKDATHRYNGTGSGNGYVIDGIQAPFLTLTPGRTYRFTNDNTGSHPFRFYLEADRSTLYSSGVDFQDTYTEITISDTTPEILHYQCSNHAYMGNAVQTNSNTVVVSTASTFSSAVDINAGLDVDGQTDLDELIVAGVATFQGAVNFDVNSEVNIGTGVTILGDNLHVTGIVSALQFIGDGSGITNLPGISTLGSSNLTDVNVSGTTTTSQFFASGIGTAEKFVVSTGGLDVDGQTDLDELIVSGVSTFQGNIVAATAEFSGNVTIGGTLTVEDKTNVDSIGLVTARTGVRVIAGGIDVTAGISTFGALVDVNNRLDVVGGANIDQVNATGISSFTELNVSTGGLDVDGQTDLDELQVAGVSTFSDKAVFNTAYPSIDADNEIQVGTAIQLGKAGVITATSFSGDGSNLTGIGTQGPDGAFRGITVAGISTFNDDVRITAGGLDVTGVVTATSFSGNATSATTATNVTVADESSDTTCNVLFTTGATGDLAPKSGTNLTFNSSNGTLTATEFSGGGSNLTGITASQVGAIGSLDSDTSPQLGGDLDVNDNDINGNGNIDLTGNINATGDIGAAGIITATGMVLVAGSGLDVGAVGVLTALSLDISTGGIDVDGQSNLDEVAIAGVTTFSALADVNNRLDVVGGANIDQVNVTGIASFKQLDVSTGGIDVDGQATLDELVVAGVSTFQTHVHLGDDDELRIGASDDLKIYHDTDVGSYIDNTTAFSLAIRQLSDDADVVIQSDDGSGGVATYIRCDGSEGEVRLYHYGTEKLATKSTGIDVTGTITADGLDMEDDQKILLGNSDDVEIYYNQSNNKFRIDADCGLQFGINGEKSITAATNGNVELYYDDSKKLETTTSGVTVTGTLTATAFSGSGASLTGVDAATLDGVDSTSFLRSDAADIKTSGNLTFNDNVQARFGSSGDLLIFHNGDSYISNTSTGGNLVLQSYIDSDVVIRADNGSGGFGLDDYVRADGSTGEAILYHYGTEKLATKSSGIDVTGGVNATGVVTASSFSGDGSALTGIAATDHVSTFDLVVAGVSTFHDDVKFTSATSGLGVLYDRSADTLKLLEDGSDNTKLTIGDNSSYSSYIQIYHDGGNSGIGYINYAGSNKMILSGNNISVMNTARSENMLTAVQDGAVTLYHNNLTRLATSAEGIDVTGRTETDLLNVSGISTFNDDVRILAGGLNVTGVSTFNDHLHIADDERLRLGADANGLDIYHNSNGSTSDIKQNASGALRIRTNHITITNKTATSTWIDGSFGAVSLYNNGNIKLITESDGIEVRDDITARGDIGAAGIVTATGINVVAGSGLDAGNTGVITATQLDISTGGLDVDGQTDLDELVVAGVSTFSNDVTFTGASYNAVWDKSDNALEFAENASAKFGEEADLEIYHATHSYIKNKTGSTAEIRIGAETIRIGNVASTETYIKGEENGEVILYHDNAAKLNTNIGGITVTGGVNATGVVTASSFSGDGSALTGVGTAHVSTFDLVVAGVSTFHDAVTINKADSPLNVNVLSTNPAINIQRGGSTKGQLTPENGEFRVQTSGTEDLALQVNSTGGSSGEISLKSVSRTLLKATHDGGVAVSGILTATAINVVAGSGYDAGNTGIITAVGAEFNGTSHIKLPAGSTAQRPSSPTAGDLRYNSDDGAFEGYTDSWGAIGGSGGAEEVDTNVSSTSAVGVGSFATASFRSAEVIAQIVQIDEYQVGKYLMIHDGTTVTVIEQAAVATGDSMLGSFDGAINGSNAELRVNMVTSGIATVTTKISTVTI